MRAASAGAVLAVLLAACATTPAPQAGTQRPAGTPTAARPAQPQRPSLIDAQDETAYAVASSLVSEVGPRFSGSPGNAKAVEWAQRKLTELGFANVHTEPVTVPQWERGELKLEIRKPSVHPLEAVALGGSVGTPKGGITAEVLSVASVEELAKLPDAAVKGKIVYFSGRMQRTRDGTGYQNAVPARRKGPADAGRKGAQAVLIRSVGTDGRAAHTGTTKYEDGPKIPAAALAPPDADLLERLLGAGPVRVHLKLTAHDAGEAQAANVVGEIPGETHELVLLGAHLDSWDITPGANDDAAGVGIIVAAARRIARQGKPHRTIRVVLFANEEFGASGSKTYAAQHAAEAPAIALLLEADSGSGAPWRLSGGVADADWPFVQRLAGELGLEVGDNGKDGGTDVEALRKLGAPEIIVGQDASKYFDVHHTANDTVETLDRAGLVQATGVFATLAHAAAQRPEVLGRVAPKEAAAPKEVK